MRLIDADYVTEKLNEINGTAELDKAFEVVENAPTVDVLDKIRAEIKELPITEFTEARRKYVDVDDFKKNVLAIIDKYKAESENT